MRFKSPIKKAMARMPATKVSPAARSSSEMIWQPFLTASPTVKTMATVVAGMASRNENRAG
jgi:hypothetical protein